MTERERFVGVWELEAIRDASEETGEKNFFEGDRAGETPVPRRHGPAWAPPAGFEKPVGLLIYLASGEMSVHFMGGGRPPFLREFFPSPSELAAAGAAYGGYAGRWEVDEARHEVVHLPEVSFVPNRVGARIRRSYSFEEISGSLFLALRPIALSPSDAAPNRVLTWRRRRAEATP